MTVASDSPSSRTSIVRPASAAISRASAIWSFVSGALDSTSHPAGISVHPWRLRPPGVTKFAGLRALAEPKRCSPTSIRWTLVRASSSRRVRLKMTTPSVRTLRSTRKSVLGSIVAGSIPRYESTAGVAT
jgi:hypothetical protein